MIEQRFRASGGVPVLKQGKMLLIAACTACGGTGQRSEQPGPDAPLAHSMTAGGMSQDPAAHVVGTWELRALNRERTGMLLQLALDSASGRAFRTRVGFLMQGDMGIDTANFAPTPGRVTATGAIHIEVGNKRGAPPGVIVGRATRDTIYVAEFVWGGEDQMRGGTQWVLVRQR
jgi:hypothetical protein